MEPDKSLTEDIESAFPGLRNDTWQLSSPATPDYNCVAFAAGDNSRWWWPAPSYFWPPGIPREATFDAFISAFVALGFGMTDSDSLEPSLEKVALFANELGPSHVARQLPDGRWTSKLGQSADIGHALRSLEGSIYGRVVQLLARSRR